MAGRARRGAVARLGGHRARGGGAPRVRADPERAGARRGAGPAPAGPERPAAGSRRAHRRADRDHQGRARRAGTEHDRDGSGRAVSVTGRPLPEQPLPPGPHLVLARATRGPGPLPGARGPAGGGGGDVRGRPCAHDPPEHPPDAIRRRLLPDVPAAGHRRDRRAPARAVTPDTPAGSALRIAGPSLELRLPSADDVDDLYRLGRDPEVTRFSSWGPYERRDEP